MAAEKPDYSDPASVVGAFIHAMHCWEALAGFFSQSAQARFRPDGGSSLHPEEVRLSEALRQLPPLIVTLYLTARDRAYMPAGSYSVPPEYDPATEAVTRVVPKTKSQVLVETDRKAAYMGGPREYLVKRQGDYWLIDSVSVSLTGKKRKLTLV